MNDQKDCRLFNSSKSPYEALFGFKPKRGIASSSLPYKHLNRGTSDHISDKNYPQTLSQVLTDSQTSTWILINDFDFVLSKTRGKSMIGATTL